MKNRDVVAFDGGNSVGKVAAGDPLECYTTKSSFSLQDPTNTEPLEVEIDGKKMLISEKRPDIQIRDNPGNKVRWAPVMQAMALRRCLHLWKSKSIAIDFRASQVDFTSQSDQPNSRTIVMKSKGREWVFDLSLTYEVEGASLCAGIDEFCRRSDRPDLPVVALDLGSRTMIESRLLHSRDHLAHCYGVRDLIETIRQIGSTWNQGEQLTLEQAVQILHMKPERKLEGGMNAFKERVVLWGERLILDHLSFRSSIEEDFAESRYGKIPLYLYGGGANLSWLVAFLAAKLPRWEIRVLPTPTFAAVQAMALAGHCSKMIESATVIVGKKGGSNGR
jgi:hypothetical protein